MRTRERTEQLCLFQVAETSDEQGGYEERWTETSKCWASVKVCQNRSLYPHATKDYQLGGLALPKPLYKVRTFFDFPETCQRFKWREKFFAVVSPYQSDPRSQTRTFYAQELETSEREAMNA